MAKNEELQHLVNRIHLAFRESEVSEELVRWDNLIEAVVNREFDAKIADIFFEAHACLMYTLANDVIDFTLNYLEESR